MLFDSNKTISNHSANIMNYLIRKLESRVKTMKKIKQLFYSINTYEDLYINKTNFLNTFSEIEDDLKQASCAIKALLTENKSLTIEIETKEKTINNLINDNNLICEENKNLKNQILFFNNNNISSNYNDINNNELYNISDNNYLKQKPKINIKKKLTQVEEEDEENLYNINQLSNVKNIMKNMKNNKKKLKDAIEKHFISNDNYGLKNISNTNNFETYESEILKENSLKYNYNELLMKILDNEDNINLLNNKMGKDFMEKIIDSNCPQEYLKEIENILSENDNNKMKKNNKLKSKTLFRQYSNIISKSNGIKKNKKIINNSFTSNKCQILNKMKEDINFDKSLKDYPIKNISKKK